MLTRKPCYCSENHAMPLVFVTVHTVMIVRLFELAFLPPSVSYCYCKAIYGSLDALDATKCSSKRTRQRHFM